MIEHGQLGPRWNLRLLQSLWPPDLVHTISLLPQGQSDMRCWRDEPAGTCCFRAIYKHLQQRVMGPQYPWRQLWQLAIWPKLQLFAWRTLLDKLPTRAHQGGWDASISHLCPICRTEDETVNHLFVRCSFAKSLWISLPTSIQRPASSMSFTHWFWHDTSAQNRRLGITLFWYLWKSRNMYLFQYQPIHPLHILST